MLCADVMPVFSARIPGVLKIGDRILVAGKIKDNARKFSVNLSAEEGDHPLDVVLHFDVRFHRDNIISLSRKNGTWVGCGSYDTNCNLFVRGTLFRIAFELQDAKVITIYCQNKFHSNFMPKIPLTEARHLVVWEDVEKITQLDFFMGGARDGMPQSHGLPPQPSAMMEPSRSMPRNRPGMCANEYTRGRNRSGSDDEELSLRRDSDQLTERTSTQRTNSLTGVSRVYRGNVDREYSNDLESNQQGSVMRMHSSGSSSEESRIPLTKRASFYKKARAPFNKVCNFVTKSRKARRRDII